MDETPLNVPEILANVLQYVDSKTLVAAAQVNSMWANEATNVRSGLTFLGLNILKLMDVHLSGFGEEDTAYHSTLYQLHSRDCLIAPKNDEIGRLIGHS